jgi:hypothetical protein
MNTNKVTNSPHYPALVKFIEGVNAKILAYWTRNKFTHMKPPVVMVSSVGKKYAKLAQMEDWKDNGKWEARSVYCFFDINTGDLLKGTWDAPVAKGIRGNVNDTDVLSKFTEHGPGYLR